MSPQTETKTGAGFKAGVKDYRLFGFNFPVNILLIVKNQFFYFITRFLNVNVRN